MKKAIIRSDQVRSLFSNHALATRLGPYVFFSGQMAIDQETGTPIRGYADLKTEPPYPYLGHMAPDSREGPVVAQAWSLYRQLDLLMKEQGASASDLLFYGIYMTDFDGFPALVRTRKKLFEPELPPPSTGAQVRSLALRDSLVMFDAVGYAPAAGTHPPRAERLTSSQLDPLPLSNYSLGARGGPLLYLAGVVAAEPTTGLVIREARDLRHPEWRPPIGPPALRDREGPVCAQAWFILDTIRRMLKEQGAGPRDVLKLQIYLRDIRNLPVVDRLLREFFPDSPPATTVFEIEELAMRDFHIEIEPIVWVPRLGNAPVARTKVADLTPWMHHSVATREEHLIFFSGQMAYDAREDRFLRGPREIPDLPEALRVLGGAESWEGAAMAQGWWIYQRLARALEAEGSSLQNLLKVTAYLRDIRHVAVLERLAGHLFPDSPPALTPIEVRDLPFRDAVLMLDAVAAAGS